MPTLMPFVVRNPSCRRRKQGDVEAWGKPSEKGYLRDDHSLVKAIPRSMILLSASQPLYDGKRLSNGFVAAHVWRKVKGSITGGNLASRDPWTNTNTFIPNLVWLPAEVAKLSDREGTFTPLYLQALSAEVYRHVNVRPEMLPIVDRIWGMLELPQGIPEQGLPQTDEFAFFQTDEACVQVRPQAISDVVAALQTVVSGRPLSAKVITSRYGSSLSSVSLKELTSRAAELEDYHRRIPAAMVRNHFAIDRATDLPCSTSD